MRVNGLLAVFAPTAYPPLPETMACEIEKRWSFRYLLGFEEGQKLHYTIHSLDREWLGGFIDGTLKARDPAPVLEDVPKLLW